MNMGRNGRMMRESRLKAFTNVHYDDHPLWQNWPNLCILANLNGHHSVSFKIATSEMMLPSTQEVQHLENLSAYRLLVVLQSRIGPMFLAYVS